MMNFVLAWEENAHQLCVFRGTNLGGVGYLPSCGQRQPKGVILALDRDIA
jgi:hypothetical protein